MARTVTLKDEKVIDSWATIIEGAQDKAATIFEMTQSALTESEAPDVEWEMVEAQPSRVKGFFQGKKRDYLMVTNKGVGDSYRMYLGARDYGKQLDVTWFLTVEPKWLKSIAKGAATLATGGVAAALMGIDIFDQQDLRAYVTVTHHCLLKAVATVMGELGQDVSKIDRKSKGSLEVW